MGNRRLPPPMDPEDAGGFSSTNYLKKHFLLRAEVNRIFEEVRLQMLKDFEISSKIYDV